MKRALLVAVVLLAVAPLAAPQPQMPRSERKERVKNLPEKYRQFLLDVQPIMLPAEEAAFLILESDAQRDAFIDAFFQRHAPKGMSGDAFRRRYYELMEEGSKRFRRSTDRYRVWMVHGEPAEIFDPDCKKYLQPIRLWHYANLAAGGRGDVFFYIPNGFSEFVVWQPVGTSRDAAFEELLTTLGKMEGMENVFYGEPRGRYRVRMPPLLDSDCKDPDRLRAAIEDVVSLRRPLDKIFQPPPVAEEPMKLLLKSMVLPDPKAPKFDAEMSVRFPRRDGNRTDAEVTIMVPRAKLAVTDVAGTKTYRVDVTGEVLKDEQLYERYRYRFDFRADTKAEALPVIFDRLLPRGAFTLRVKVADAESHAEAIVEKAIDVPDAPGVAGAAARATEPSTVFRIVPLPDEILFGPQRIETIAGGDGIAAVEFYLDGRKIMTKRQPPFTLDLDLGDVPQARRVRAIAVGAKGEPLAADEIEVNGGNDPFRVRIVWPRVAVKLTGRARVEMSVNVPEGKKLESVQLFYNDTPVGTLFDPPFVQTVDIPATAGVGYLRAVATLAGDPSPPAEDTVVINTPQFMEELNVHLVELPTTVTRDGHPVQDLDQSAFTVLDDGKPAKIAKFEHVTDLPLSVGLAIDTSGSMQTRIGEAQKAAAQFFKSALKPGDRAFLVSFDVRADVVQKWSSDFTQIAAGLAKLRAEESTALYDAVVSSLYNFHGIKGQKALVLITDGKDTASKFTFDQALEYARRASVPIYAIGLGISAADVDTRFKLGRLATETGGNIFYIQQASELDRVYAGIQSELRSQYILGIYPPEGVKPGAKWREVSVQAGGANAKTIRGYYP